jgi:hypothetical protein
MASAFATESMDLTINKQPCDIRKTSSKIDQICDQTDSFKQSTVIKLFCQHHGDGNARKHAKWQIK